MSSADAAGARVLRRLNSLRQFGRFLRSDKFSADDNGRPERRRRIEVLGEPLGQPDAAMGRGMAWQFARVQRNAVQVNLCMKGIGASLYRFDRCLRFFCKIG